MFGIGLAIFAMLLAPVIANAPDGLFTLMKKLGAIFNIPILAVIMMALISRGTPAYAAKICLFLGMATYCCFSWVLDGELFGEPMHWLHFAGLNFVFLCILMWGLGKLGNGTRFKAAAEGVVAGSEEWAMTRIIAVFVVIATVILYITLNLLGT